MDENVIKAVKLANRQEVFFSCPSMFCAMAHLRNIPYKVTYGSNPKS